MDWCLISNRRLHLVELVLLVMERCWRCGEGSKRRHVTIMLRCFFRDGPAISVSVLYCWWRGAVGGWWVWRGKVWVSYCRGWCWYRIYIHSTTIFSVSVGHGCSKGALFSSAVLRSRRTKCAGTFNYWPIRRRWNKPLPKIRLVVWPWPTSAIQWDRSVVAPSAGTLWACCRRRPIPLPINGLNVLLMIVPF